MANKGPVKKSNNSAFVVRSPQVLHADYQNDWNKFRERIPGNTGRVEVRKQIRLQMNTPPKVCMND